MVFLTATTGLYLSVVGLTYLLLLFYCVRHVMRYKHEFDSNCLTTTVVIVSLFIVLLITSLLPADIMLASVVKAPDGSFQPWATNETLTTIDKVVYDSYYAIYAIILLLVIVILPFMHFLNDPAVSSRKITRALKLTVWFALAATALLTVGAFVPTNGKDKHDGGNTTSNTGNSIVIVFNKAQDAMNLIMTFVTLLGLINVVFYTATGIMSWPIGLLLGTANVSSRTAEINEREMDLRLRITTLEEKARNGSLSSREQSALLRAQTELQILEQEETTLNQYSESWSYKLRKLVRPAQIFFGSLVIILSILLVINLGLVGYDRFMNGLGFKHGYILEKSTIPNPIQYIFMKVHNMLLFGPMPLLIINCILVIATISGMRNLGLWLFIARIYKIKVRKTQPQAMLYFCASLILAVIAFNILFYSIAPEYVTFGNQNFQKIDGNSTVTTMCNLKDAGNECIRTRISVLIAGMMSQVWIFGAIFFWMTLVFQIVSVLSAVVLIVRGRRQASHGLIDNEDDFQD